MKTKYAVCNFNKDGSIFPVRLSIPSENEASSAAGWMKIGAGQFDDWRVVPMSDVRSLLIAGKVDLAGFTEEAQKAKRAEIMAS